MIIIDNRDGTYAVTLTADEAAVAARYALEAGGGLTPIDAVRGFLEEHLAELRGRYDAFDANQRKELYDQATPEERAALDAAFESIKQRMP